MQDFIRRCWNDDVFRLWILPLAIALTVIAVWTCCLAQARDLGQWTNADPAISSWYKTLMQPDNPTIPCCGSADAYYADKVVVRDNKAYAVITDDRPDEPLKRPHIAIGTEFEIPANKLKWSAGNPTGHNVLFVGITGVVYCFVQGTGI